MYALDEARLVFLPMPRTASKSTGRALIEAGGRKIGPHHGLVGLGDVALLGFNTFTTVRNHFDAIVSWWFHDQPRPKKKPPDVQWVRDLLTRDFYFPQPGRFWGMYGLMADRVLRFETIERDLELLFLENGAAFPGLPFERKKGYRDGKPFQEWITPSVREFVEEHFDEELRTYGYSYD